MKPLTRTDLIEIDKAIDATVPSQPLLSRSRDVALIHALRYFDAYTTSCGSITQPGQREIACLNSLSALDHSVRWIFRFCTPHSGRPNLRIDAAAYEEAGKLHALAQQYTKIWHMMSHLFRGTLIGSCDEPGVVRVFYSSNFIKDMDIAKTLLAAPYDPEVTLGESVETPELVAKMIDGVKILASGGHTLRYFAPKAILDELSARIDRLTDSRWELEPSWDLGGYTVLDLRKFWTALNALCTVHLHVCCRLLSEDEGIASLIKFMTRRLWVQELSRRSSLAAELVSAILSDLTYQPELQDRRAHISFQPFISFGREILGVSVWLVYMATIERNIWELVSLKRPEIHSALRNLKEGAWIEDMSQRCQDLGLRMYPRLQFEINGQRGEIDLLMLDQRAAFGLVCELKWLTIPAWPWQAENNDKEIAKAIKQAERACEWVKHNHPQLSQRTGLSKGELSSYEFRPIVMCKKTLASGLLGPTSVPVINERLFNWLLGEPHRRSLATLWSVADERRYLPQIGKHFEDISDSVEFGKFRFWGDPIGYALRAAWNPSTDINLEGLP